MKLDKNQMASIYNFFKQLSSVEAFISSDDGADENLVEPPVKKDVPKRSKNHFSRLSSLFGVALGKFNYDRRQIARILAFIALLLSFRKTWYVHGLVIRVANKSLSVEEQYKILNAFMKKLESVMRLLFFQIYFPSEQLRSMSLEELKESSEARSKARRDPISCVGKIEFGVGLHLHLLFFSIFRLNPILFVRLCKLIGGSEITVSVQRTPADQVRSNFGAAKELAKTFCDILRMLVYLCKEDGREQLPNGVRMMFIHCGNLKAELARSGKEVKQLSDIILNAQEIQTKRDQFQLKVMHDDFFGIRECKAMKRCNLKKFGNPGKSGKLLDDDKIYDEPEIELEKSVWKSIELLPGMFRRLFKKLFGLVGVKLSAWWFEVSLTLGMALKNMECRL